MIWVLDQSITFDALGLIPAFLNESDPRPAREQLDSNYGHGGGWTPIPGFSMRPDGTMTYPGDPPLPVLAETILHKDGKKEIIRFYHYSWVSITQTDGSFEVCRMD